MMPSMYIVYVQSRRNCLVCLVGKRMIFYAGCGRGVNTQAHEDSGWNGELWCYSYAQAQ